MVDTLAPVADRPAFRANMGLAQGEPVIGLLAGSRSMERRILGPVLLDAASLIRSQLKGASFLWSSLPQVGRIERRLQRQAEALGGVEMLDEGHDVLRGSDIVISAMGTAVLEAAATATPVVATYDASTLAKWIGARLLRQQREYYAMPNILLAREAVPEIVPAAPRDKVTAQMLADEVLGLLGDPRRLAAMRADLLEVRGMLGEPGAARRTAELIADLARSAEAVGAVG